MGTIDKFDGRADEIFEYLRDSCNSAVAALMFFELDCEVEDIEELMQEHNYECCPHCGWWVEAFELIPEDSIDDTPDGYCGNCRVPINDE